VRVYLDSSAVIKRVIAEQASDELVATIDEHESAGDLLVSSSLAWIEMTRALHARANREPATAIALADDALSGVAEQAISAEVVSLARRLNPSSLRSLDAIHLASALLLDVHQLITYDDRLIAACRANGVNTLSPGR
jgi:predicted nucleic acid-binding protein